MSTRRIVTVLLGMGVVTLLALLVVALVNGKVLYALQDLIVAGLLGGLLAAHLRGFRWAAEVLVVLTTLLVVAVAPSNPTEYASFAFTVLTPVILAAVLLPWYWSLGAFLVTLIGLAVRWGGQGLLFEPNVVFTLLLQAVGIILASVVARTAQHRAEANAEQAQAALMRAEEQQRALAAQADALTEQNVQQGRLLDLVPSLEVPTVTLADGVVLAPIVGNLDRRRAQALTSRLLATVSEQKVQLVILDIVGVSSVDTAVAKALMETTQAVRLLGCNVTVTGISAAVATTLTHLNIGLEGIRTARSPQEALELYWDRSGTHTQRATNMSYHYGRN